MLSCRALRILASIPPNARFFMPLKLIVNKEAKTVDVAPDIAEQLPLVAMQPAGDAGFKHP